MKVKLPSFNSNVSIEEYLDSSVFGSLQIEGRRTCLVGSIQLSCTSERKLPI